MGDALDVRRTVDGRRRINLTRDERDDFAEQALIERAVALFLDITEHRTTQQIADELGISRKQLKDLTKRQRFIDVYNEQYPELGHDPRLAAVRDGLADLLPVAFERLGAMLTQSGISDTVRSRIIFKIFELNGIQPVKPKGSDKKELADFLKEAGVNLTQNNTVYFHPGEEALDEILEGEFSEEEPSGS